MPKWIPLREGLYCPKYESVIMDPATVHIHFSLSVGGCTLPQDKHLRANVFFEDRRSVERRSFPQLRRNDGSNGRNDRRRAK